MSCLKLMQEATVTVPGSQPLYVRMWDVAMGLAGCTWHVGTMPNSYYQVFHKSYMALCSQCWHIGQKSCKRLLMSVPHRDLQPGSTTWVETVCINVDLTFIKEFTLNIEWSWQHTWYPQAELNAVWFVLFICQIYVYSVSVASTMGGIHSLTASCQSG